MRQLVLAQLALQHPGHHTTKLAAGWSRSQRGAWRMLGRRVAWSGHRLTQQLHSTYSKLLQTVPTPLTTPYTSTTHHDVLPKTGPRLPARPMQGQSLPRAHLSVKHRSFQRRPMRRRAALAPSRPPISATPTPAPPEGRAGGGAPKPWATGTCCGGGWWNTGGGAYPACGAAAICGGV